VLCLATTAIAPSASAEELSSFQQLSPIASTPSSLLCEKPAERGTQYLACDAYKELGEPISPVTLLGSTKLAIRIVWVPSFHTWSVVRIELTTPERAKDELAHTFYPEGRLAIATEIDDNTKPGGGVRFAKDYSLHRDDVWTILSTINARDFFTLPSVRPKARGCVDGTEYIVEMAEATRYHWALLSCFYKPDPRDKSLNRLISLLQLVVRAYAPRELSDFPGN
jgi:hypothetical protein